MTDDIELTRDIVGDTQGVYALRVKGHSFQSALINDGDIVILRRGTDPVNGDMVAVLVEGQTLIRRWFRGSDGMVELRAEAPGVPPVCFPADLAVQGKVIAVIRHPERESGRPALAQPSPRKSHKTAPASETLFDRRGV